MDLQYEGLARSPVVCKNNSLGTINMGIYDVLILYLLISISMIHINNFNKFIVLYTI